MTKKELRQHVRELKKQYSKEQLIELSSPLIAKVEENKHVKKAQIIMLYYSLPDEVYTHNLVKKLAAKGKTVLLPVVVGDNEMILRIYKSEKDLRKGEFDIMEPVGEVFEELSKVETVIVPGMSFDSNNNRLGRGKGYYDRFLSKMQNAYKIGLCFDFQKSETIPTEQCDVKMNEVI